MVDRRRRRQVARARRIRLRRLGLASFVALVVVAATVSLALDNESPKPRTAVPRRAARIHARARRPPLPTPIPGYLLIADRGNNRVLLVDSGKHVLWQYPGPAGPVFPFRYDDD